MAETPETVEVNVVMGAQLRAIVRSALLHVRKKVDEVTQDGMTLQAIDDELVKWPLSVAGEPEDTLAQWLFKRFGHYRPEFADEVWGHLNEENKAYWEHEADAVRRAVGRGGFKLTDPNAGSGFVLSTPINELHQKANENTSGEIKSLRPLDLKNTESLGEAIRIAVGAASTCWTNVFNAGVFKSEDALDISAQLEHHFHSLLVLANKQIWDRHQALASHLQNYWSAGVPMIAVSQVRDILAGRATPEDYTSALQVRPSAEEEKRRG